MKKGDDAKIAEIKESGFEVYSCPRVGRTHGGLAVIYKPTIKLKVMFSMKCCQKKNLKIF